MRFISALIVISCFASFSFAQTGAPAKVPTAPPVNPPVKPKPAVAPTTGAAAAPAPGAPPPTALKPPVIPVIIDDFAAKELEKCARDLYNNFGKDVGNISYGIVVDSMTPFWTPMGIGAQNAARELKVAVSFEGPSNGSVDTQKKYVQTLIQEKYRGMAVSTSDSNGVGALVKTGKTQGMSTVAVDSDLPRDARSIYIGTDNFKAGIAAGHAMQRALNGGGGKIVLAVGNTQAFNVTERIRGIKKAFEGSTNVISETIVDNNDAGRAETKAAEFLSKPSDVQGIITLYSYNAPAFMKAMEKTRTNGKFKMVSFDMTDEALEGLKKKTIDAVIAQRPYYWGRMSVYALHSLATVGAAKTFNDLKPCLEGPNKDILDTQVDVVTAANLASYNKAQGAVLQK